MNPALPASQRAAERWATNRGSIWARGPDAGGQYVPRTPLGALVYKYLTGRVRRGELLPLTASNHWSALAVLMEVHGNRPVEHLGKPTIERWLEARTHVKPSTKRNQWSMVSQFCEWLVDEQILRSNPCRKMKAPRRLHTAPRTLEGPAVGTLLDVAPDARATAIVWLMVGLGLRCVSVSKLKIEDWSRRDQVMRVIGKAGHEHEVPVIPEVAAALTRYLAEFPATVGPLVRSYKQPWRSLSPGAISNLMSEWMLAAGVKQAPFDGIGAHALRRTCASDVLDNCGDLRTISALLGHLDLASAAPYLRHAGLPRMREAMAGRDYEHRIA